MRRQLLRLRKKNSTKGERRIGEILKRNRIPFLTRQKIGPYEADFVIGKVIVEVDGSVHKQTNSTRDIYFSNLGYVPLHVSTNKQPLAAVEKDLLYLITQNNHD